MKVHDKKRILVIDDEENVRHMLQILLGKQGYSVKVAQNGLDGLELALRGGFDFILCDIRMPVLDGPGFLGKAIAQKVGGTIIMMSAYGTMDLAIECVKKGAYDFISKPFKSDEIVLALRKAEEREGLRAENRKLREEIAREYSFENIVSRNSRMQDIFKLVRKVCDYRTTVLILGESGTGKELVARAIHFNSNRMHEQFVAVNCGAIPETLLESELFGHVRGAFTDARADKKGLFEEADGGTLFLDEIGEMPPSLQVKILRVLQDGEIRRIGSAASRKVDVRVISATSKDLAAEVEKGTFREDLYFRLNVFVITIPPLRERMEDLPLLVDYFVNKYGASFGKGEAHPTPEMLKALMGHDWPGNVRELENCIERSLVLSEDGTLGFDGLPDNIRGKALVARKVFHFGHYALGTLSIKKAEELLERDLICRALEKTGGNRTHASRLLEISHRALLYKLKEYGIE